jgi:hypothetical protein
MLKIIIANILFELNLKKRLISTYAYFLLFAAFSALMMVIAGGGIKGAVVSFGLSNKVNINSSVSLTMITAFMGVFGLFIIAPAFGQALFKDFGNKFDQIIYSYPANRKGFLIGRFLGALLAQIFIFSSIALGLWIGTLFPNVQAGLVGENKFFLYVLPYFTSLIPNFFIFGSMFFLISSKTKKMAPVYICCIILFMAWMLSGQLQREIDNKLLSTLIDPFGLEAISQSIRYWSAAEQNNNVVVLFSYYLYNRLLWGAIGLTLFIYSIFTFNHQLKVKKSKALDVKEDTKKVVVAKLKDMKPVFNFTTLITMTKFEISQAIKNIYFQMILLAGILFVFVSSTQIGKMYGTNTFPVTENVISLVGGSFSLFILIILTFYAGEVVWNERQVKINEILDSYDTPTWMKVISKWMTLNLIIIILLTTIFFCGLIVQTVMGYHQYDFSQYFFRLFVVKFISYFNLAMFAFFIQVIVKSKYLGHALMILYYLLLTWLPSLGFSHKIYRFNAAPLATYSDMNKFGRFIEGYFAFKIYWFFLAFALLMVAALYWQRGSLSNFKDRKHQFIQRLKSSFLKWPLFISLGMFFVLGGFVYYNTNVLNTYRTSAELNQRKADYEKKYKKYANEPIPIITSVDVRVNIFPKEARVEFDSNVKLENKTNQPIKKFLFHVISDQITFDAKFSKNGKFIEDENLKGVWFFEFEDLFTPGEKIDFSYKGKIEYLGFANEVIGTDIVENGTFFNQWSFMPSFGYQPNFELSSTKDRTKYGLEKKKRMPPIDDEHALQFNYISNNASWIDYRAVVCTDPDQIAISPGYLQKEWVEQGRRCFDYKMDQKILNFYSFLSARYEVKRDKWNDVNIEVYYHKGHEYNLDGMIEATKSSLDYFTKNFSPYQHKQFRILEFPRYATFAQAFPNTIPFSEAIGFIADVDDTDPKDVNFPYYVTSHEMAHQWFAHQIIGGGVEGVTMLSESFAQYGALMVMKKKYGHQKMRRFLKHELDRYLFGRSQEHEYENPLYLNENQQYIHYQKGSLIMYALQEHFGEKLVNSVISEFISQKGYQEAPFTTSLEFLDLLYSKVPQDDHPFLDDLFKRIVLFDNKIVSAKQKKLENGKIELEVEIEGKKLVADQDGQEKEEDFEKEFTFAVEQKEGEYIYFQKHLIKNGMNKVKFVLEKPGKKFYLDPIFINIDKSPTENDKKIVSI